MSAHFRQYEEAVDHLFEAGAIMRLVSLAIHNMPAEGSDHFQEVLRDLGNAADGGRRLTDLAVLLLEDVSDGLRNIV